MIIPAGSWSPTRQSRALATARGARTRLIHSWTRNLRRSGFQRRRDFRFVSPDDGIVHPVIFVRVDLPAWPRGLLPIHHLTVDTKIPKAFSCAASGDSVPFSVNVLKAV